MDRRHLSLARETDVRYELLIPGETEAMLLDRVSRRYAATSCERSSIDVVELIQIQGGARRGIVHRRGRNRLPALLGPRPAVRADAVSHARRTRARRRASKTSPCRSKACRFSCGTCRTRSSACRSRRRYSAMPPRASCTCGRSSISPTPTMSARWKSSPPSCTSTSGCCAARSAASMATDSAARRSSRGNMARS